MSFVVQSVSKNVNGKKWTGGSNPKWPTKGDFAAPKPLRLSSNWRSIENTTGSPMSSTSLTLADGVLSVPMRSNRLTDNLTRCTGVSSYQETIYAASANETIVTVFSMHPNSLVGDVR